MATDYKCDICGKPATVHITKIIDNKKIKVHLCSECAEKASLESISAPSQLLPKIQQLEEELIASHALKNPGLCPNCGASLSELEKGARFSCPQCYAAMGSRLLPLFLQMHGATQHTGKTPKFHNVYRRIFESDDKHSEAASKAELCGHVSDGFAEAAQEVFNADVELSNLAEELQHADAEDDAESLKAQLENAIKEERYEDAAKLRDKLKSKS